MTHQAEESEYYEEMIILLEWLWGEGFMAPGGEGHVDRLAKGLDLRGRHLLDIGSGLGGPAFILADKYHAHVTGIDLEAHLIEKAQARAVEKGLERQVEFLHVKPGRLDFPDHSFDVVLSSGALTQIEDKAGMFSEISRVLKPGGVLTSYEWLKNDGAFSADMLYFFEMEGLTYKLVTLEDFGPLLAQAGFSEIVLEDASGWYRTEVRREYELISGPEYARVVELVGRKDADHLIEDWRSMAVVCEKGELLQGYIRGRKPV